MSPLQNPKYVPSEKPFFSSFKNRGPRRRNTNGDGAAPLAPLRPPPLPARAAPTPVGRAAGEGLGRLEAPLPKAPTTPNRNQPPLALLLTLGNLSGSPGCLGITFCNL